MTWKRFYLQCPEPKKGRRGHVCPTFFRARAKTQKRLDVETFFPASATWKRFRVPCPKNPAFGSPKLVSDKSLDVETFAKCFHIEPVDPKSWRRGNVFQNVSTSSGKARRGNVFRIGAEECPTWKRFGPKGARLPWVVSVLGGLGHVNRFQA